MVQKLNILTEKAVTSLTARLQNEVWSKTWVIITETDFYANIYYCVSHVTSLEIYIMFHKRTKEDIRIIDNLVKVYCGRVLSILWKS